LEGFAVTIGPAPRDSAGQRSVALVPLVSLSVVIAAVALLAFYFVGRALSDLDAMQADMNRISERLGTLEAMNRQMGTAIGQLKRANAQLIATNRTLDHANGKLEGTDATLSRISADLGTMARGMRSIDMMRSDIDMVTRKIGDSFLFRGVKVK
jgi:septal ring factor EnvC (AmiA/AmiB activator)